MNIQKGDLIALPGHAWRVTSVYKGTGSDQKIVECHSVHHSNAHSLRIPAVLINQKMVYRVVHDVTDEIAKAASEISGENKT